MLWELSDKSKINVLIVFITIITGLLITGGVIVNGFKINNYLSTLQGQTHLAITMIVWMVLAIAIGRKAVQENEDECGDCGDRSESMGRFIV